MFLAKLIRDVKNEELGSDFFMWESDSCRSSCRGCNAQFATFLRRHHCRICGGLFCEVCSSINIKVGDECLDRVCKGCKKGLIPGGRIRAWAERKLKDFPDKKAAYTSSAKYMSLSYGSPFNDSQTDSNGSTPEVPKAGYFEIINKSLNFCCVKVLGGGMADKFDFLWELSRPSYIPIAPGDFLNCQITDNFIYLFVLFSNINAAPVNPAHSSYKPSERDEIGAYAKPENFLSCAAFMISCSERNVLLKLKPEGLVEPRKGNSLERKGFLSIVGLSRQFKDNQLNFETNVAPCDISKVL